MPCPIYTLFPAKNPFLHNTGINLPDIFCLFVRKSFLFPLHCVPLQEKCHNNENTWSWILNPVQSPCSRAISNDEGIITLITNDLLDRSSPWEHNDRSFLYWHHVHCSHHPNSPSNILDFQSPLLLQKKIIMFINSTHLLNAFMVKFQ